MTGPQLYDLALAKGFPRVELRRMTSGGRHDWVGPGAVAWGLFADHVGGEMIEQARDRLNGKWAKKYERGKVVDNQ